VIPPRSSQFVRTFPTRPKVLWYCTLNEVRWLGTFDSVCWVCGTRDATISWYEYNHAKHKTEKPFEMWSG